MILGLLASILVIGFGGDTHSLLPRCSWSIYFFYLSQSGMFTKWMRERKGNWCTKY